MTSFVEPLCQALARVEVPAPNTAAPYDALAALIGTPAFRALIDTLVAAPVFDDAFARDFAAHEAVPAIAVARMLRGVLNLPVRQALIRLGQLADALQTAGVIDTDGQAWHALAAGLNRTLPAARAKLVVFATRDLADETMRVDYQALAERLEAEHPHALYPTSVYRECTGHTEATADDATIDAVVRQTTFATVRTVDRVLEHDNPTLADVYSPIGRCVCVLDANVDAAYRTEIEAYFAHHDITLHVLVYRAMEIDKDLSTVERLLADFKRLGVSREAPVLIAGGGVLADTAGLACALYGRNTPYVMLATSIVTGIDAGPSPRTCCDGFGYKNLMGAYHPPVLSLTDRYFFNSLHEGWLRHGVAEIIKMAVVKDATLFADLEAAQPRLVDTRFGTRDCAPADPMHGLSQRILTGAMRAYIQAEYGNLYETHQCRPHAYGHTWSPGFEIQAGLLHGHAVAIGMGFGAFLSHRIGWLSEADLHRVLTLISGYGLALWDDVLADHAVMAESHTKILDKRGGNLVAPLPRGTIGQCGYLNDLSVAELTEAVAAYEAICIAYPREGRGIDAYCVDVGLEAPSTTGAAAASKIEESVDTAALAPVK